MIWFGLFSFLFFLSAVPLFFAVCRNVRPERTFLAAFLVNGLLFYAFAACGIMRIGFFFLFAANLLFYVPALIRLKRSPRAIDGFLTEPVKIFYAVLLSFFGVSFFSRFIRWDEFSHWGTASKLLFESGKLNCCWSSLLEHASYVPGLPVLETMTHLSFFGMPFHEPLVFFGVWCFFCLMVLWPLQYVEKEKGFCYVAFAFLLPLTIMAFWNPFWSCESDCPLGVLFALAVYAVLRNGHNWRDDLLLALLLAWLVLVKKAGFGFAIIALAFYLFREIAFFKRRKTRADRLSMLLVAAAPFLARESWSLLLTICRTPIIFPVNKISAEGICGLILHGNPEYAPEILRRFCWKAIPHLSVFAALMTVLFFYVKKGSRKPEGAASLFVFLPVSFLLYAISLFLTYVFIFSEFQAHLLVSFVRYMNGFMLMPLLVLFFLVFSGGWSGRIRHRDVTGILFFAVAASLLAAGIRVRCSALYREDFVRRVELDAVEKRYGKILKQKGNTFHLISGEGLGVRSYVMRYLYLENFQRELNPKRYELPDVVYTERIYSPEELCREFRSVRFVLIAHPSPEFLDDYREIFADPAANPEMPALYRVSEAGKLVALPPQP